MLTPFMFLRMTTNGDFACIQCIGCFFKRFFCRVVLKCREIRGARDAALQVISPTALNTAQVITLKSTGGDLYLVVPVALVKGRCYQVEENCVVLQAHAQHDTAVWCLSFSPTALLSRCIPDG